MNQEQKIAKVLAEHWSASTRTNSKPFVDRCDGCGAVIFSWGDPTVSDGSDRLAAHQAAVLAPLITAAKAEALREAAEQFGETQTIREGDVKEWLRARAAAMDPAGRALVNGIIERKAQQ